MRNHISIAGLYLLLGAGLSLAAFGIGPPILEMIASMSDGVIRLVQITVPAVVAFAGFYLGTRYKHRFDLRLDAEREKRARQTLALELRAELRNVLRVLARLSETFALIEERSSEGDYDPSLPVEELALLPQTPVFAASVGRIGILGPDAAERTIEVFSRISDVEGNWNLTKTSVSRLKARISELSTKIDDPPDTSRTDELIDEATGLLAEGRLLTDEEKKFVDMVNAYADQVAEAQAEWQQLVDQRDSLQREQVRVIAAAGVEIFSPGAINLQYHVAELDGLLSKIVDD